MSIWGIAMAGGEAQSGSYCETFNSPAYNHRYNCSVTCNIELKEWLKGCMEISFIASVEIVVGQGQW